MGASSGVCTALAVGPEWGCPVPLPQNYILCAASMHLSSSLPSGELSHGQA